MGEIAEMMISGELCAQCGVVVDCGEMGIPVLCDSCYREGGGKNNKPVDGMLPESFYGGNMRIKGIEEKMEEALKKIKEAGLDPVVKNKVDTHISVGDWNFWASTGRMFKNGGSKVHDRGIENFIKNLQKY